MKCTVCGIASQATICAECVIEERERRRARTEVRPLPPAPPAPISLPFCRCGRMTNLVKCDGAYQCPECLGASA